ncbi:cohesin complex subunit [Coemansia sp. RSA 986]|nr:cohesin complex subunit [Coemansia sp. RSA 986]
MATPTRRSTRVSKAPDRLAAPGAMPPPSLTPRKRSKEAGVAAKEVSSAFAMPLSASSKRQKTGRSKQKPGSRPSNEMNADEDSDNEVSESSGSSSENDEDETSDFEELQAKTPLKTPQRRGQKKTTQGTTPASRVKPSTGAPIHVLNDETNQLLNAIIDDNVALAQVAMDWISSYREGSDQAVCELINFFVKLTGCPGSISEDALYESEDIGTVLDALQKQSISALRHSAEGDVDGDLLLGKSKEHRKFRKNALLFVQKLVIDGQHHLVFDEVNESNNLSAFTEVVLPWLANMAGSSYRPFRHAATLISLTIQSALVSVRAHISVELQTTHRQLDAELNKKASDARRKAQGESARAQQLRVRVATLTEQDELADAAFMVFYNTVFIYRYRDVNPMIRSECLVPLATWCRTYPASYLNTEYLRYLGWSLNDKDPRVRESAISAVTGPLLLGKTSHSQGNVGGGVGVFSGIDAISEESFSEGIRPFIVRFLARIVQIAAGDVDSKVQVAAIKLVAQLGKHGYLDPSAKIGDIRNLRRGSRRDAADNKTGSSGKGAKGSRRGRKRNAHSHEKYSHSLSQQLLEESSSESEGSGDDDAKRNDDGPSENLSANVLNIHVLYDADNSDDDTPTGIGRRFSSSAAAARDSKPLSCPHHSTMRYLAPLVAHTHASVRSAASELVAWWIKKEWVVSAQVSALGVDTSLEGGVLNIAGDDEDDSVDDSQSANDDAEMSGDSEVTVSELLSSPTRKRRARNWLLFKSLGAFLWHLSRTASRRTNNSNQQDEEDPEGRKQWVMEQATSCVEEMWATPASSVGLATGEEQSLALAGSTISGIASTALDTEIESALGSDQCAIPPRTVAAAQALWHKIPELCDLSTLSAFLAWDHSALQQNSSNDTALSCFALSQNEETALLQAYAVWILENSKAIADKKRRSRNKKDKSDLDEEMQTMSRVWQSMFVPLLVRNIGSPDRLVPLVYLASEAMDLQVLFDADRVDVLRNVAKNVMLVLERHGENVRLSRLATCFLERVDSSAMLAPNLFLSSGVHEEDEDNADGSLGATTAVPGNLICKAARTASSLLVTAVASVPETPRSHTSYADVYARVVALRSIIRSKDISALLVASSYSEETAAVALESAEEYADLNDRSSDTPIEQLYMLVELAVKSIGLHTIPEKAAVAVLDVAYYFLLWRALKFDKLLKQHPMYPFIGSEDTELPPFWKRVEAAANNLKKDRDRLIGLCLDLVDETALNYSRLRELAFAVLGRTFRLFTGAIAREPPASGTGSQRARELRRTLALQNGSQIRSRLVEFFEHRLASWVSLVGSLSQGEEDTGSSEDLSIGWYKDAPSSWSIAYSRFCTLAALWAQWIGDQTVPMGSLSSIAAYTGMLGLEPLEKLRLEASLRPEEHGDTRNVKTASKRKVGFVALSAFDHIVQAAVDSLKPMLVLQNTRDMAMDVYMSALRLSLEKSSAGEESPLRFVADTVNTGTLARFVGSALRSAFSQHNAPAVTPARGRRGAAGDGAGFTLAPAVVGTAWVQHHLKAIDYGLLRVVDAAVLGESNNILDDDDDDDDDDSAAAVTDREPSSAEEWETQAAPWFAALAQTVTGVLRPRHAEVLGKRIAERFAKLGVSPDSERAGDADAVVAAVAPYQRALDRELAKLDAINARMAEVRAAGAGDAATGRPDRDMLSSSPPPPVSPTPASRVRQQESAMDVEESGGGAADEMDVDE